MAVSVLYSTGAKSVLHKHETEGPLEMAVRLLQIKEYDQQKLDKYGFSVNSCAVEILGV